MKTAEAFRKSIGGADEKFVHVIRQTLTELEQEEAKPVKKKISTGLVLAMAVMLLTVTALAASQWGILDFIKDRGADAPEYKLVTAIPQQQSEQSQWVDISIDEALVDGHKAYLALTIRPKEEKMLVIPLTDDLTVSGGMAAMKTPVDAGNMSIKEYAQAHGFEQIVGIQLYSGDFPGKVTDANYVSMEDGTLQCVLECAYQADNVFAEQTKWCFLSFYALNYKHGDTRLGQEPDSHYENMQIQAEIPVNIQPETKRSRLEDAHDVVGYIGAIEYVTMTPLEDGSVQFTMMVDMNDDDEKEMYFWTADLVDSEGNKLFWLNGSQYNMGTSNKRLLESTIPAAYAEAALAQQVTIRVYGLGGAEPTYDTYTYTME